MNYYAYTFKTAFKYINRHPTYWFWFTLRALFVISEILMPIILGHLINLISAGKTDLVQIGPWILVFSLQILTHPSVEVFTAFKAWVHAKKVGQEFRQDAVELLKHTGLSFWQDKSRGGVMKVIDKAYDNITFISANISHMYLWWGGRALGVFLATSFFDPIILVIYLLDILLFIFNLAVMIPKEQKLGVIENKGEENVNSRVMEYLNNFRTVVYLNLYSKQEKEISYYNQAAYDRYLKREYTTTWKWYYNNQLHNITMFFVFVYSVLQVLNGQMEVGTLTTIVFFAIRYAGDVGAMVWQSEELVHYVNSLQRFHETFGHINPNPDDLIPSTDITFETMRLDHVALQRADRETLKDVSFYLKKGGKLAIVGYTGSGKSTLLDIILKAITEYQGDIFINEHNYRDLRVADITNIFSIVPQEVQLFKDSIKGNLLASNPDYQGDVNELLGICQLKSFIKKLPNGLETKIHEGSANVSGGERQRIGIARSLLEQQPVLVLDEATASLDPKTERRVITNIMEHYPELAMIYITHKYSLLNYFDHILVMDSGKVIEQGDFESLRQKGGLFNDLFQASQV